MRGRRVVRGLQRLLQLVHLWWSWAWALPAALWDAGVVIVAVRTSRFACIALIDLVVAAHDILAPGNGQWLLTSPRDDSQLITIAQRCRWVVPAGDHSARLRVAPSHIPTDNVWVSIMWVALRVVVGVCALDGHTRVCSDESGTATLRILRIVRPNVPDVEEMLAPMRCNRNFAALLLTCPWGNFVLNKARNEIEVRCSAAPFRMAAGNIVDACMYLALLNGTWTLDRIIINGTEVREDAGDVWWRAKHTALIVHSLSQNIGMHGVVLHVVVGGVLSDAIRALPSAHNLRLALTPHADGSETFSNGAIDALIAPVSLMDHLAEISTKTRRECAMAALRNFSARNHLHPHCEVGLIPGMRDAETLRAILTRYAGALVEALWPTEADLLADGDASAFFERICVQWNVALRDRGAAGRASLLADYFFLSIVVHASASAYTRQMSVALVGAHGIGVVDALLPMYSVLRNAEHTSAFSLFDVTAMPGVRPWQGAIDAMDADMRALDVDMRTRFAAGDLDVNPLFFPAHLSAGTNF
jgi:hypothetical protein